MSDSPASLLFLPSLRVFPHSAGRSWVFLQADAGPFRQASCSSRYSLRNAHNNRKVIVCAELSLQCRSCTSCSCLRDPLPRLSLYGSCPRREVRHRVDLNTKEWGSRCSPGENGAFAVAGNAAVIFCEFPSETHGSLPFCLPHVFPFLTPLLHKHQLTRQRPCEIKWGSPSCETGRPGG